MKKSKYGMPGPLSRLEFEHNMYLVVENTNRIIESGDEKAIQNMAWSTLPHLEKAKKLPNGRIDLKTINQQLRLHGNSMHWMSLMPPYKKQEEGDQ